MNIEVFTLWAVLKDEEPSPWMIAAEDEFSWEGNPERCEASFADARDLAARNDWEVREITLTVPYNAVAQAFVPAEIAAEIRLDAANDR